MQKSALSLLISALLATAALLGACSGAAETQVLEAATSRPDTGASALLPPAPRPAACRKDGRLSATLYGALGGDVAWEADEMTCEGMPRPGGEGARLRFAGPVDENGPTLAFIVAIPALKPAATTAELATRLTIIEEGRGRFFSSAHPESCWTEVRDQHPLADDEQVTLVSGKLFCIAPLAEVNGASSVSIEKFEFTGIIDWNRQ